MVERTPILDFLTYLTLTLGIIVVGFPIYYCFIAATHNLEDVLKYPMPLLPGTEFFENMKTALEKGQLEKQLLNSVLMSLGITVGKISVSLISAFAIVYFNFRIRMIAFWMVFVTLMLPVEIRILPTYEVTANLFSPFKSLFQIFNLEFGLNFSLLDSFAGLILPLTASATATFLFRQFFLTLPEELNEASKIDGATPMQFFWKILLPLSKTNMAALFVIVFVHGWNQYLWPLLVTTQPDMKTIIVGVQQLIPRGDQVPQWNIAMGGAFLAMVPPIIVVIFMQRWFVKGLVEHEK